jgi:ubiquinone/menaquinone biosynthesis C-methylase UbiE
MSFEKAYYESPAFWAGNMVADQANTIRIEETIKMIPADVQSLIDVGCGNGKFLNKILANKSISKLIGIDRSMEALKHVLTDRFISDINDIKLENGYADCVSCLQVLEHIPFPVYEKSLSELARVSRKYILISVPYKEKLEASFTSCPKCKTSFNKELHLRNYFEKDIDSLFEPFGFKILSKKNIIASKELVGINAFRYIKNKITKRAPQKFESPICILCGFDNENKFSIDDGPKNNAGEKASLLRQLKKWWPTYTKDGYWILALYEKK